MNINKTDVVKFLHNSVYNLIKGTATNNRLKLDNRLAIFVGWKDGFSKYDDAVIHDKNEPTWGIVAGIKVWTSDDMWTDFDYLNFPYYEDGEVLSNYFYVSKNENYESLAKYLLNEYEKMKDLCMEEDGKIVPCDDSEDDSINESFTKITKIDWQALVDQVLAKLKTKPLANEKKIDITLHTSDYNSNFSENEAEMTVEYFFPHSDDEYLSEFNDVRNSFDSKLTYHPEDDTLEISYYNDPPYVVKSSDELAEWIDESI